MIQDKSERFSATAITSSHVSAEEWSRRAIFLRVPRSAMFTQIAGTNTAVFTYLEILPKRRIVLFVFQVKANYNQVRITVVLKGDYQVYQLQFLLLINSEDLVKLVSKTE